MPDINVDLSAINAEAEKIQNEELVNTEEEVSTGHKVLFYIFLGALCLLGIGVPVLIFLLVKKTKECKKLKAEAKETAPAETNAAEGSETENKGEEPKAEEKSEPEPEKDKKKK